MLEIQSSHLYLERVALSAPGRYQCYCEKTNENKRNSNLNFPIDRWRLLHSAMSGPLQVTTEFLFLLIFHGIAFATINTTYSNYNACNDNTKLLPTKTVVLLLGKLITNLKTYDINHTYILLALLTNNI